MSDQKMEPVKSEDPKAEEVTAGNKEVSFKLDEPVTTALNINPLANVSAIEEDSLSFVVLGKDSVEAQASLLASYVDIQQKSMAVDYKSIVSSMSSSEMQRRLTEMLQENVKLKETLRQNNEAMKQQFSTLAMWQEEVTKVHQNHKQKFAETKGLINHLKKENTELKHKLWLWQHTDDIEYEMISAMAESDTINASIQELQPQLTDTLSKITIEKGKEFVTSVVPDNFANKELQYKSQINEEKELESTMTTSTCKLHDDSCIKNVERLTEECLTKNQKIASLEESIALLEQKLQCVLAPVELHDLSETSSNLNRQKFEQNIKQYNDTLQELTKCFVEQTERFAATEKSLREITDILKLEDDNTKLHKEKLCQCYKQLTDEQIQIISDRQTLIKSQNQFQKLFSDYKSILYELEITIDENAKLNVLSDNSARETSEQLEQIERDKQSLEEEKKIFEHERSNLENEKKSLESQKTSLDKEHISLRDERKLLEQEKISLNEEKMSLDHQSQLYEDCERDLHKEKKVLQVRNEQLLDEINNLQQQLEESSAEFQKIMEQLAQTSEEMQLLRSQLVLYEEDFLQEKQLKEALLEEKSKLTTELQKQIEFNKQLQDSDGATNFGVKPEHTSESNLRVCPKCSMIFLSLPELIKHVDRCLEF